MGNSQEKKERKKERKLLGVFLSLSFLSLLSNALEFDKELL